MKKTYGLSVEVSDDGREKPLSQAARAILFRAIRELLINVIRHAGVSKAYVGAARLGEEIEVTVTDDGNGFDSQAVTARSQSGFGLTSVRERLSFIGGNVEISSVPGDGTEVILKAPLQMHEQQVEDAAESTNRGKSS
jgi:signal transduction histidine kinase